MSRAIVTGGTKNDADAMAVLAMNLKDTNPGIADCMIIFHDGISLDKQQKMKKIMPIRFIRYKYPVPIYKWIFNRYIRYFSPMIFCKYETFALLDEYDEVMWTDYDVVIKDSICELWYCEKNYSTIVNHEETLGKNFNDKAGKIKDFKYDMNLPGITTPLFVLKRGIGDPKKLTEWCYDMTRKYIKYLYLPEQCIFTMLASEFKLDYEELDLDTYCLHPKYAKPCTKILHAYGQPKFWNGLTNDTWNRYYEEYKNL